MAFDLYRNTKLGTDVTTYVRPCQTISLGPLNGPNTMVIYEETITVLPDLSVLNTPLGPPYLSATITDPNQSFNIVDPTTGNVIGTKTFAQLKCELYSLYLYLASARDLAAQQAAP